MQLYPDNIVYDNKARMLLKWSANLLQESKNVANGLNKLQKAEEKIIKAINTLPEKTQKRFSTGILIKEILSVIILAMKGNIRIILKF